MAEDVNLPRLRAFVNECGGVTLAAWKLNVRPSTLKKLLAGRLVSAPTREKLGDIIEENSDSKPSKARAELRIICSKLQGIIKNEIDLLEAASRFNVNPSTINKILQGASVSLGVVEKIRTALEGERGVPGETKLSMVERLREIHRLYEQHGTLEAVGKQIGVTRERVRQLLAKGSKLGLFEYKPFDYPFVPKEKILADYEKYLSSGRVAKANSVSIVYLRKLLTAYRITEAHLRSLWIAGQRNRCIDAYNQIKDQLGHHPTTTELQRAKTWRYLSMKIPRLWGSFDAFREQLSIPKPPKGSPRFSEDTRRWREARQRLGLIVRMQHLDRIRECLSASRPMTTTEIAYDCGLSGQRALALLQLLMATGEVIREGIAASTKYRLANARGKV